MMQLQFYMRLKDFLIFFQCIRCIIIYILKKWFRIQSISEKWSDKYFEVFANEAVTAAEKNNIEQTFSLLRQQKVKGQFST